MREIFIRIFGREFTYRDVMQLLVALILWNLLLIWHERYRAYKPMVDMAVSQKLLP